MFTVVVGLGTTQRLFLMVLCTPSQVGMLGANAPDGVKERWGIDIAGPLCYPTRSRWGHMISAHYLKHLKNGDYPDSKLHTYMMRADAPIS